MTLRYNACRDGLGSGGVWRLDQLIRNAEQCSDARQLREWYPEFEPESEKAERRRLEGLPE